MKSPNAFRVLVVEGVGVEDLLARASALRSIAKSGRRVQGCKVNFNQTRTRMNGASLVQIALQTKE